MEDVIERAAVWAAVPVPQVHLFNTSVEMLRATHTQSFLLFLPYMPYFGNTLPVAYIKCIIKAFIMPYTTV